MPKPTYDELVQLLVRLDYAGQLKRCYSESYIIAFMDAEKELADVIKRCGRERFSI